MKICLINNLYPPYERGGAEQVVYKTVQGLLNAGYRVVVITTSPDGAHIWKERNLSIYRYRPKNLFFYTRAHKHGMVARLLWHIIDIFHIGSAMRIRKILKKEKPDAVHTHNLMGVSFLVPRAIRSMGLRHLHTVHDVQLAEPSGIILKRNESGFRYNGPHAKVYAWIIKKLMGSPDVVISPSQFLLDFYEKRGFFKGSGRVVIRNPVSIMRGARGTRIKKSKIKDDFAAKRGFFNFLYIGQIEEHKGIKFLLEAFIDFIQGCCDSEPSENNKNLFIFEKEKGGIACILNIVGGGSQLGQIIERSGNYANIVCHGKVDRSELPKLFEGADVTVVPSLCYENSPTVIFESLSFGVPVLASRVEGISELIKEGENGFTFNTGDSLSLKRKFLWCLKNRSKLFAMSQKAAESLVDLSEDNYIKRLKKLYLF